MKEKSSLLITILLIILILALSGCIVIRDEEERKPVYFLLTYSTSSDIEDNVSIAITTNNVEVFNQTIIPTTGSRIYREEASGYQYHVTAVWNNKTAEADFKPDGYNTLFLTIRNNNIELQEITE